MTDTQDLIAQLRLGASISRDRNLNLDFAKVADQAADALEAAQAEIAGLKKRDDLLSSAMDKLRINTTSEVHKYIAERDLVLVRLTELEEALVYAAHIGHGTPQHMTPEGMCLFDNDGVQVKLPDGRMVFAGRTPQYLRDRYAAGASPAAHVPETDCGNIEAMQPNSCAYCTHPLFAGLKCKHCGRVAQPSCLSCKHNKYPYGSCDGCEMQKDNPENEGNWEASPVQPSQYGSPELQGLILAKLTQPSQAGEPDMFWNHDDAEKLYDSVEEFLNDEICNGTPLEVGDVRTIQCAIRLPNFDIRVTSIDEEESEAEFEIIAATNAKEQLNG